MLFILIFVLGPRSLALRTSCLCIEFQTNRLARLCVLSVCVCVYVLPCHSHSPYVLFRFHFPIPFQLFLSLSLSVCFALHLINFYALFVFKHFSLNRYNIFSVCPVPLTLLLHPSPPAPALIVATVYVMR